MIIICSVLLGTPPASHGRGKRESVLGGGPQKTQEKGFEAQVIYGVGDQGCHGKINCLKKINLWLILKNALGKQLQLLGNDRRDNEVGDAIV
jgi:hypothetical protein